MEFGEFRGLEVWVQGLGFGVGGLIEPSWSSQ